MPDGGERCEPAGIVRNRLGRTRTCPHCKAVILETASVCPQCRHHLKFGAEAAATAEHNGFCALKVEGTLQHNARQGRLGILGGPLIRNERGEEVSRQVIGVGALRPSESRTFTLSVDVNTPGSAPGGEILVALVTLPASVAGPAQARPVLH